MKFLLDESADFPLAAVLEEMGHEVTAIAHDHPHALKAGCGIVDPTGHRGGFQTLPYNAVGWRPRGQCP